MNSSIFNLLQLDCIENRKNEPISAKLFLGFFSHFETIFEIFLKAT